MAVLRATSFHDLRPGDWVEDSLQVTPETIRSAVAFSGDTNPVHTSDAFAASLGLDGAIAHGLIVLGLLSKMIGTLLPGPGSIWYGSDLTFKSPVRAGDRVTIRVTVKQVSPATRSVVLTVSGRTDPKTVLEGSVKVRVPARMNG